MCEADLTPQPMKEGGQRLGARSEMDQSLVCFSLVSCTGSLGALVSFVLLLVLHGISLFLQNRGCCDNKVHCCCTNSLPAERDRPPTSFPSRI